MGSKPRGQVMKREWDMGAFGMGFQNEFQAAFKACAWMRGQPESHVLPRNSTLAKGGLSGCLRARSD